MRDLNDAVVFVKVVEQGSFTAAARLLRLPKSTVSRRVQLLEARLGVQLLQRTTRSLGLTEAGKVYFEHCREISRELEEAKNAVAELHGTPRGWLRLAAAPTVASAWVAPLLGQFSQRYPEIQVELLISGEPPDMIGSGLDLALYAGALPDSNLALLKLASFDIHAYASPDYLLRYGEPSHPDELEAHRVLALTGHRQGGEYQWTMHRGRDSGVFPIRPLLVCSDASLLQATLLAGEGIALACGFSMNPHLATGAVRKILPGWRGPRIDLHAVFPRHRAMAPKVRVFIDFLADRLASPPAASGADRRADAAPTRPRLGSPVEVEPAKVL
jgi:LysR family transcriptional regulator, regulator for bpeEF and oprC